MTAVIDYSNLFPVTIAKGAERLVLRTWEKLDLHFSNIKPYGLFEYDVPDGEPVYFDDMRIVHFHSAADRFRAIGIRNRIQSTVKPKYVIHERITLKALKS